MKTAIVTLSSATPYSQGKHYEVPRLEQESDSDYEKRTWRERMHVNEDGYVFIPPMAFKNCISECAKYLGIKIPGKGNSNYTKHFEAGAMVMDQVVLPLKKEDVPGEWLFVPSNGQRGGGSRVNKCFPVIHKWSARVTFYILDETITEEVFAKHIDRAGKFIGIGRFRPRKNGYYGRFNVENIEWS